MQRNQLRFVFFCVSLFCVLLLLMLFLLCLIEKTSLKHSLTFTPWLQFPLWETHARSHTHTHTFSFNLSCTHTLTSIALILFHQLSLVATTRSHARTHTHKTLSLSTIPLSTTLPTYSVNQNDPRQEELNTLPAKGEDTHQQQRATTANSWRTTPATTPGAPGFGRKKSWLPSKSSYRQNFSEGGGQMKTQSSRQQQKTNKPQFQFSPD